MVRRGINGLVSLQKWETVIWTSFVEVSKIHLDLPFAIFLLNQHHISQPFWMVYLHYEFLIHEFIDFYFNDFAPFLFFRMTSLKFGSICSLWQTTIGLTLGMSSVE